MKWFGLGIVLVLVLYVGNETAWPVWQAKQIGDVELAGKTYGELNTILRSGGWKQEITGDIHPTPVQFYGYRTWWLNEGVTVLGNTDKTELSMIPAWITIRAPFRGTLLGIHIGDSCLDAEKRIGVQSVDLGQDCSKPNRHRYLRRFDPLAVNGGAEWDEDRNHRITWLAVWNKPD